MELAQTNTGNTPKSYSLNMFQDFVPMCVFSESNQGKLSCEGKVEHKFDMEPHSDNLANYGQLCRERTQKYMVKPRQVQVLDNDHGMSMRPMPGMVGLIPSGSKVVSFLTFTAEKLFFFSNRQEDCPSYIK
uniref:ATP binding protein n=1 Tax=Arundo donax TaxID=35708 RepID=A0A0A9CLN0_ARUDO